MELLTSNEILTPPHMFDLPLPPINDIDPPILFPEPKSKLNTNQFSPEDESADIISSPLLLINDSPPTIVTNYPLLNDDGPNLNSIIFHRHLMIHLCSSSHPSVPLSPEPTSTITDPPTLNDQTHIPIKTLSLPPFTEFPLFNQNDPLALLLLVSALVIENCSEAVEILIPDEILILPSLSCNTYTCV